MHNIINLTFFGLVVQADMRKYAYMVWDRNFSYFCNNRNKRTPPCAGRRNVYKAE